MMPHLHNCPHDPNGWCLTCVGNLYQQKQNLQNAKRSFIDQDSSGHWYLVDADKRAEWSRWYQLDDDDPMAWDVPSYAKRLTRGPHRVTFTNAEESA